MASVDGGREKSERRIEVKNDGSGNRISLGDVDGVHTSSAAGQEDLQDGELPPRRRRDRSRPVA